MNVVTFFLEIRSFVEQALLVVLDYVHATFMSDQKVIEILLFCLVWHLNVQVMSETRSIVITILIKIKLEWVLIAQIFNAPDP